MLQNYIPPKIETLTVKCEHSIASGSANINVGSSPNQANPEVEDWNNDDTRINDFDI